MGPTIRKEDLLFSVSIPHKPNIQGKTKSTRQDHQKQQDYTFPFLQVVRPTTAKQGTYSLSIYSYLEYAVVLESFRMLGLAIFFRPNILKTKNTASIYGQDMELPKTESHMHIHDIKSSPSFTGHNNNISMSSISLILLTNITWKFKTPGGILVFQVSVQV